MDPDHTTDAANTIHAKSLTLSNTMLRFFLPFGTATAKAATITQMRMHDKPVSSGFF